MKWTGRVVTDTRGAIILSGAEADVEIAAAHEN